MQVHDAGQGLGLGLRDGGRFVVDEEYGEFLGFWVWGVGACYLEGLAV